ncbi:MULTISPECIES: TonB-dependent receptor [unclassified Roseateles]|uniref:TonB-dependent receptor n=1 Tax=unclassified Roseateles TaxID=2626991 RepID=UPI0006F5EE93|nr:MULTISPECIES: TonB-dependent receptor [unclassified Roseateles]KQW42352.1 TonB-dependent receptor [Pelomonas sp. Root405]KRA68226.1 TonB-dependent receptor [Pelomonas sp. Root662]
MRTPCPSRIAAAAALLVAAFNTQAQPSLERVEVTGTAIKRIEGETALPVQVITRGEIDKAGVTTAAELIARLSASANNLTDGGSVGTGGFRDQMGFNGANLRGLGVSSTLVLLNGRRMANFASPGDAAGVDLNSIPAAAIQRVEILLDGASSLYGSDAIGGVINFITRKDFTGIEVSALYGDTSEGGGGKRSATLAGGFGDYARDGLNVFAVVDMQKTSSLNASQRKFIKELDIPGRLPDLLSSYGFPGNIRLSSYQYDVLFDEGLSTNGKTVIDARTINPAAATGCLPANGTLYLPDGIGGVDGCTFDYMRDIELYPKSNKTSGLVRGVLNVGGGHQAFAEVSLARARTYYTGTPNRTDADVDVSRVPILAGSALNNLDADDDERLITLRMRLTEAGLRTSELVSNSQRVVLGMNGLVAGWDYEWALNHSRSKVSDRDHHGYLNEDLVLEGFANGTLNGFGPSSAAGLALYESAQIRGEVRRATGTMASLDMKASKAIAKLAGGDLALAFGGEFRREKQRYYQSEALAQDIILGETSQGPDADFGRSRNVGGVFAEVSAPVTKQLELQAAVRYERYQVSGGAGSPKLGLRYVPMPEMLLRASVGKGFRAPSLTDLYRPVTSGNAATLVDPVCLQQDPDATPTDCSEGWSTQHFSNPELRPEKSRQFSMGVVFEPRRGVNLNVDYWNIEKSNLISTLGVDVILGNLDKYGSLVHRYWDTANLPADCADSYDPDDYEICAIDLVKENRGKQKISGVDLGIALSGLKTGFGQFGLRLNGTLTLKSKQQTGDGDPFVSNLGRFINDGVVQRWRHTVSMDWERGPFSATVSNSFLSGYDDQHIIGKPDRKVGAYSLWNLSAAWEATKSLTLRAGVQNAFDKAPPFSQQAWFFLSGYDPSYTDPRGRYGYVSAKYSFR